MDIYNVLHQDHQKVKHLMTEILATDNKKKKVILLLELSKAVLIHAKTEENVFYERLEQEPHLREQMDHAREEHKKVEDLLDKLIDMKPEDAQWINVFSEIKKGLEHHIQEEENEIFPSAKKVIDVREAEELGTEMALIERAKKKAA